MAQKYNLRRESLHCELEPLYSEMLKQLVNYTESNKTQLIQALIAIAWEGAATQIRLSKEYPDKLPEDLSTRDGYYLMHITNIFDGLYPSIEDLED